MLNLPQKTLDTIKRYLLRQQREVEGNLRSVGKDDPVTSDGLGESTEPGTASWMAEAHNRTEVMKEELKKMASNVKKALLKIKTGTYGQCERCGKQIEPKRLEVIPIATLCLSCSKKKTK